MLVHMPEPHRYELLGQTVDDAAGEAFDKVARFLGPRVPRRPGARPAGAQTAIRTRSRFPRAMADSGDYDFSLSGLKTAVLRHVKAEREAGRDVDPADLAASFQEAIVDVQVTKTIARRRGTGVSGRSCWAAASWRTPGCASAWTKAGAEAGLRVLFPSMDLCTDNGAMIARRRHLAPAPGRAHLARRRGRSLDGARVTTFLVTGGAGFIGSHLCDRLLAEGHRVVAVDDLSTGRIANLGEARGYGNEFTFFNMDVRAEGLLSLFERHRPEVVMHLAAQAAVPTSVEDPVRDAARERDGAR